MNKLMTRVGLAIFSIILVSSFFGCEAAREVAETGDKLRETARKTKKQLRDIQSRGLINFETQMKLNSIFDAYSKWYQAKGQPPKNWGELSSAKGLGTDQRLQIRDAKKMRINVQFGLTPALDPLPPDFEPELIAWVGDPQLRMVATLWTDGSLQAIPDTEFEAPTDSQ